jgi:hypothetical protein
MLSDRFGQKPANKKAANKAAFCRLENVGADQRE